MKPNEEQLKAINCTAKNILVTARAGSGKTFVLTERTKRLLNNGVKDNQIIIFSFTNNAVNEVNERLGKNISKTFHSFSRSIIDNSTSDYDLQISRATYRMTYNNIKDIEYILIDEFQDFKDSFYKLLKRILELKPSINIFAVGDDWQHIFDFKSRDGSSGSKLVYFQQFENYFPNPTKLYLLNNYRSKEAIVEVSNQIMKDSGEGGKAQKTGGKVVFDNKIDLEYIKEIINKNCGKKTIAIITRDNKEIEQAKKEFDCYNLTYTTAHSSKGLEFDIVIIFSRQLSFDEYSEQNLRYVAHSRAKDELYTISSNEKHLYIDTQDLSRKYNIPQKQIDSQVQKSLPNNEIKKFVFVKNNKFACYRIKKKYEDKIISEVREYIFEGLNELGKYNYKDEDIIEEYHLGTYFYLLYNNDFSFYSYLNNQQLKALLINGSQIPKEIGNLQQLEALSISGSQIPKEIGNLKNLKKLSLERISGELPKEIFNLQQLEELSISGSKIPIPKEIGNLKNLKNLSLERISGELPKEIFNLEQLEELSIWGSQIPKEIGNLKKLKNYIYTTFPKSC